MHPLSLLFLSIIPGLIWLFFFLLGDKNPEPKRTVLKAFFFGMISAFPAVLLEWKLQKMLPGNNFALQSWQYYFFSFLTVVLGVALIEEMSKYIAARISVLRSSAMDEPIDVILYMIIAALGFATIENIFLFFSPEILIYNPRDTFYLAGFRFLSATFLHALCSGTIGYFMALSFYEKENRKKLLATGFLLAVLLHGLYNFSIMNLGGFFRFGIPLLIITGLAIFIYCGIGHLKKLKSICKI